MMRIVIVVSSPETLRSFLRAQIVALSHQYEVWVVANMASENELAFLPNAVRVLAVQLERRPAPLRDLAAVWTLFQFFRRARPALVHSVTPKAGLLAMVAARAAGIPVRVHTFTGQVWVTRKGWSRRLLKSADRAIAALATDLFVDSAAQRDFLLREGLLRADNSSVLADGTLGGVDTARFAPDSAARSATRSELGIPENGVLFLFIGRFTFDKGILELVQAFRQVQAGLEHTYLVLVGPDEDGLLQEPMFRDLERLTVVGPTRQSERFMQAADVLCLPSKREGCAFAIIEAASTGLPAVASRIYGTTDAIVDGETGVFFPPGDVQALANRMIELANRAIWRSELGAAARRRALTRYPQDRLTAALLEAYARMLQRRAPLGSLCGRPPAPSSSRPWTSTR
jgi:glycosyltransferase involved in cell wall biosynthesis